MKFVKLSSVAAFAFASLPLVVSSSAWTKQHHRGDDGPDHDHDHDHHSHHQQDTGGAIALRGQQNTLSSERSLTPFEASLLSEGPHSGDEGGGPDHVGEGSARFGYGFLGYALRGGQRGDEDFLHLSDNNRGVSHDADGEASGGGGGSALESSHVEYEDEEIGLVPYDPNNAQKRFATQDIPDPTWPSDFTWSYSGQPSSDYNCIQINEPSEQSYWRDNYFCWKSAKQNPKFQWSYSGTKSNMRCTRIHEPSDSSYWDDNYLCVPTSSPFQLSWAHSPNQIAGKDCILWEEPSDPHTWQDNYLCAEQGCAPLDSIPATHATPGKITYDSQRLSGNVIYPAGTIATLTCAYNPFQRRKVETTCEIGTRWDKDPSNECTFDNPPSETGFRLLPNSLIGCPPFMYLSKKDCHSAALLVSDGLTDGEFQEASYVHFQSGCSIATNDKIYYNLYEGGPSNPHFDPVCSKGSFTRLPKSFNGGCPVEMNIIKENCTAAGLSVGGKLRDGELADGSWDHVPFGCSIQSNGDIHYNSNNDGENDGSYQSLCHELPFVKVRGLSKCPLQSSASKEDCDIAGLSVGGILQSNGLVEGSWIDKPAGCFLSKPPDNIIHFNTNPAGDKDENYVSVCHKIKAEDFIVLPPKSDSTCPSSIAVQKDDCKAAGEAVGGMLLNGDIVEGSWDDRPVGCSFGPVIQFNNVIPTPAPTSARPLAQTQDGNFHPICHKMKDVVVVPKTIIKCPSGKAVIKDNCVAAGLSVGGQQNGGLSFEGSWNNRPSGCYVEEFGNKLIFFNENADPAENEENDRVSLLCQWECIQRFSIRHMASFGCQCIDGYMSRETGERVLRDESEVCISSLESTAIRVTSTTITYTNTVVTEMNNLVLTQKASPNDILILDLTEKFSNTSRTDENGKVDYTYTFSGLSAGHRYGIKFSYVDGSGEVIEMNFPAVTSCSACDSQIDKTGPPNDFNIIQDSGYVMFSFEDCSVCEEAYSFTRTSYEDGNNIPVSFTRDYFFIPVKASGSIINPLTEASDNLVRSKLIVGKDYKYCVRAVHPILYMDHPFDYESKGRTLLSSSDTCADHRIRWEASIHGKVITEPNAGSLPIKDVQIAYTLLHEDELTPIDCDGCTGTRVTTEGGAFDITFNVDHQILYEKNSREIPVKVTFSKRTNVDSRNIDHKFLCNNGEDDCSGDIGMIIYLSHLQFREQLNVYDDTSVPFSGKVSIANTEGCALSNAEVCLIHERNVGGVSTTRDELGCGKTNSDGIYSVAVIIGSRVDRVDVKYHNHAFERSQNSNFQLGTVIKAEKDYHGMDFVDIQKARLMVDVVGGLCNKILGKSTIQVKVVGCDWEGMKMTQAARGIYDDVPAHLLGVEVVEITDPITKERHEHIFEYFQGAQPLVRTIDLKSTAAADQTITEETESLGGNSTKGIESNDAMKQIQENNLEVIEKEEKEDLQLVRFQFNGELQMKVSIIPDSYDVLHCSDHDSHEHDSYSFHVLEYMQYFFVKVDLKYEIIKDKIFCDILDSNLKLRVENKVGVDEYEGFEDFFNSISDDRTKEALKKCEDGCLYPIRHITTPDVTPSEAPSSEPSVAASLSIATQSNAPSASTMPSSKPISQMPSSPAPSTAFSMHPSLSNEDNIEGNRSLAHVSAFFATGRPNIVAPFTKSMFFTIQGRTSDITHRADFVVEGYYSKGPGQSFALPTHKPIMILRDPPGGLSYATYENVVTTMKLETSSTSDSSSHTFGINLKGVVDKEMHLCTGGGFGALILGCTNAAKYDQKIQLYGFDRTSTAVKNMSGKERSNQFSTTWSYETSSDPWTAGALSDVFVVPNLNVMYREVYIVKWNSTICAVNTVNDDGTSLPITTTFNIEDTENQPGLAFFSRYHVKFFKIPELNRAIASKTSQKDDCGCTDDDPKKECTYFELDGTKKTATCAVVTDQIASLQAGIDGWNMAFKEADDTFESNTNDPSKSINNWFTGYGAKDMYNNDDAVKITDQAAGVAPPSLMEGKEALNNELLGQVKDKPVKRIQFSGGGNLFSMTMDKEKVWDEVQLSCWEGCNREYDTNHKSPGFDEVTFTVSGAGLETQFLPLDFNIHVSHESTKGETDTTSTSIGFVLGDEDTQDEFVVDLFYDDKFGTIIFETVSGQSMCPRESKTAAIEDPSLEITKRPSKHIFPEEDMVFELNITNVGIGNETGFVLYANHLDNDGSLKLLLDGVPFVGSMEFSGILKNKSFKKTLVVQRGPISYEYAPLDLTLESACEYSSSSINNLATSKSASDKLWNVQQDEHTFLIKFVEPCPKVEWAGELNRDRHFVVNTNSDDRDNLEVTVFNPNHGKTEKSKFHDMTSNRLQNVFLYYRKVGDLHWSKGRTEITSDDGSVNSEEIDFAAEYAYKEENVYGYSSLKWALANKVPEGTYEIRVDAECDQQGEPADMDLYSTPVLSGIIDLTPPEQYGQALPLRESVLMGEEIAVVFTEPVRCEAFDLTVTVQLDEMAMAVCGQTTKCIEELEGATILTSLHVVRCCSEEDKSGIDGWVKNDGCNVWAKSKNLNKKGCYKKETFEDAKAICKWNEARLCTKAELDANCARGTMCYQRGDLTWSSDPAISHQLNRNDPAIQIVCDSRKVGFHIDLTQINVEDWIGKTFTVEMGKINKDSKSSVFDLNGNPIERNVKFQKTFGDIDLNQASTSFAVTLNGVNNCSDINSQACTNEIENKIASLLVLSSSDHDRIEVESVTSISESAVDARIKILPDIIGENGRMLRHGEASLTRFTPNYSIDLFRKLQNVLEGEQNHGRKLDIVISSPEISTNGVLGIRDMKILPGDSDMKLLTTDPEMVEMEEELRHYGSMKSDGGIIQPILSKVERQVMVDEIDSKYKSREEAMMNEMKKDKRNMVDEIDNRSKSREEAMISEMKEESKKREEALMNKIERMSDVEGVLLRELKKTSVKSQLELKALHFQLASVTLACVGISVVAFLALRRTW